MHPKIRLRTFISDMEHRFSYPKACRRRVPDSVGQLPYTEKMAKRTTRRQDKVAKRNSGGPHILRLRGFWHLAP